MKRLTQMGIQQWRLKPGFTSRVRAAESAALDEQRVAEHSLEIALPNEQRKADQQTNAVPREEHGDVAADPLVNLDWQGLQAQISSDPHCPSCGPHNALLGAGNPNANWVFVVDAPSLREVEAGHLLVGRAGQLFEAMLHALQLSRSEIYTTSVFKCAPSDDLSVVATCDKLLFRQIELIEPRVVVTFGEFAAQSIIKSNDALQVLRTKEQYCYRTKVPIVPTHSPAEMLEDLALKSQVWTDLKKCMSLAQG